jgi:hypothetical protein
MLRVSVPVRSTAWLLLLSLFLCYLALAPATTDGRGYVPEDKFAGMSLLASFNAWVKGRPVPPVMWTRHGPVPLIFDLPFLKLGKLFITPDFFLSLSPILLTAAMLTIAYVWLRKLCTPGMTLLLTLIAAFGTMLWPYAYIGLETKQSFFVFLAGYLALADGKIHTWPKLVLFAIAGALAISIKSTGLVLAPPIAYLVLVQFRKDWRTEWNRALAVVLIMGAVWTVNLVGWSFFWAQAGGGARALQQWVTTSPLQIFANAIGLLGSTQKGLFIFAPVLLLTIYAIPRALRVHREMTIFALLVGVCMLMFLSLLIVSADELWGPRFFHVTIAPLLMVIGAACPRFQWPRDVALVLLGAIGIAISFLGAFYYYGGRSQAAAATDQNTLEWLAGDSTWNEVEFDARLFQSWMKPGNEPIPWTPSHIWAWDKPANAMHWKTLNLRDYDDPQSFLLYYWRVPLEGPDFVIFSTCWISMFAGPLVLAWVIARTIGLPSRV